MWGQPPRLSGPGKAGRLILDSKQQKAVELRSTGQPRAAMPTTRIGAAHVLSFPACDDVSV